MLQLVPFFFKIIFAFILYKLLWALYIYSSVIVGIINRSFHTPPKAQGFVSLPLQSFSISISLRGKRNRDIRGSPDEIDLGNLLDKHANNGAFSGEDQERIERFRKDYPHAFRGEQASSYKSLKGLQEYLEDLPGEHLKRPKYKQDSEKYVKPTDSELDEAIDEGIRARLPDNKPETLLKAYNDLEPRNSIEKDSKARLIWKATHSIPKPDWGSTSTTVHKPEASLATTDDYSASQSSQSSIPSSLPVKTSAAKAYSEIASTTDTTANNEKLTVKKESTIDFVLNKQECEMSSFMDPED